MTAPGEIPLGSYSHDVLLHDSDEALIEGTRAFVERGLSTGGQVLVHGTPERVAMFRAVLGSHERLDFGLDRDLYQSPTRTLFAYQRSMHERSEQVDLWATGTVPVTPDHQSCKAWGRYESSVNAVLDTYAFHGLCTYDVAALPAETITMARATHPTIGAGDTRRLCADYQPPEDYLDASGEGASATPASPPVATASLHTTRDLSPARALVHRTALSLTALSRPVVQEFVLAVSEVLTNALVHGRGIVLLEVWADASTLTCQVSDAGTNRVDPLSGFHFPGPGDPRGLWVARQLCDGLSFARSPDGATTVVVTVG